MQCRGENYLHALHKIHFEGGHGEGLRNRSGKSISRFLLLTYTNRSLLIYAPLPLPPLSPLFFSLYSLCVCLFDCGAVIIKTEPWGNADLTPKRSDTFWHWHISKGEKHLEICMREINVSTEKKTLKNLQHDLWRGRGKRGKGEGGRGEGRMRCVRVSLLRWERRHTTLSSSQLWFLLLSSSSPSSPALLYPLLPPLLPLFSLFMHLFHCLCLCPRSFAIMCV